MDRVQSSAEFKEPVLKHLEFVQDIITRMARNSFLLKGWTVTLVSAIFILSVNNSNPYFLGVAFLPTLAFWGLDAYYLRQERLFRSLYTRVADDPDSTVLFSMDTSPYEDTVQRWWRTAWTVSIVPFYGAIATVVLLAILILQYLS